MEKDTNKVVLDEKTIERLNKIDWDGLKASTGITRQQVERFPSIAKQLAYGQYTDLLYGNTPDISGQFSLRAIPGKGDEPWRVKAYTMEKPKSVKDDLYYNGAKITSDTIKEALFAKTSWENSKGEKVYGRANANAGRAIAVIREGEDGKKNKEYHLISLHEPTNRIVGIPVEAVKAMLLNEDGVSRGTEVYGTALTTEQALRIAEGKAVKIEGKTKEGNEFKAFVQFDVAKRQIVTAHPTWLKEAERAGEDLGLGNKEAKAEVAKAKKAPAKKAAETQETKAAPKLKH